MKRVLTARMLTNGLVQSLPLSGSSSTVTSSSIDLRSYLIMRTAKMPATPIPAEMKKGTV